MIFFHRMIFLFVTILLVSDSIASDTRDMQAEVPLVKESDWSKRRPIYRGWDLERVRADALQEQKELVRLSHKAALLKEKLEMAEMSATNQKSIKERAAYYKLRSIAMAAEAARLEAQGRAEIATTKYHRLSDMKNMALSEVDEAPTHSAKTMMLPTHIGRGDPYPAAKYHGLPKAQNMEPHEVAKAPSRRAKSRSLPTRIGTGKPLPAFAAFSSKAAEPQASHNPQISEVSSKPRQFQHSSRQKFGAVKSRTPEHRKHVLGTAKKDVARLNAAIYYARNELLPAAGVPLTNAIEGASQS